MILIRFYISDNLVFRITFGCSAIPTVGGRVDRVAVAYWTGEFKRYSIRRRRKPSRSFIQSFKIGGYRTYKCLKISVPRPPPLPYSIRCRSTHVIDHAPILIGGATYQYKMSETYQCQAYLPDTYTTLPLNPSKTPQSPV